MSIPVKRSVWIVLSEMTGLGTGSWNEGVANEGKCGKILGSNNFWLLLSSAREVVFEEMSCESPA